MNSVAFNKQKTCQNQKILETAILNGFVYCTNLFTTLKNKCLVLKKTTHSYIKFGEDEQKRGESTKTFKKGRRIIIQVYWTASQNSITVTENLTSSSQSQDLADYLERNIWSQLEQSTHTATKHFLLLHMLHRPVKLLYAMFLLKRSKACKLFTFDKRFIILC